MTQQYDDDLDIDYTSPPSGGSSASSNKDMDLDPYDDLLDVDALDDASWDEPMPAAQPRKAMKSGKAVKGGKKSSMFTLLLVVGAVVVGLGILYFQFSGSSTPAPSTMPTPLPNEAGMMPTDPNAVPPGTDPNMAGQAMPQDGQMPATGADLMALQQAQNDPNAVPQPVPTDGTQPAPAQTGGLLNDPTLMPQADPNAAPVATTTTTTTTTTPAIPSATDVQKAATPVDAPVQPAQPAPTANNVVDTPPAPAPEIVTAAPATTTTTTTTAAPTPAAVPDGMTTIATKELDDMRANIARLEAKVKELESKPAPTTSASDSSSSASLAEEIAPAPKKKTTAKKKSSSSTSSSTAKKTTSSKTASSASSWELRGIAGGKAIVAKRGSEDFQSVGVGDNLSGVGTIQSITNQNGAWVIQGSSGRIRQ